MPKFNYIARDREGHAIKGTMVTENETALARELEAQGLMLLKAETVKELKDKKIAFKWQRIKRKDIIVFTRQFATMVRAGIPILKIFQSLAEETSNRDLKRVIAIILRDIQEGKTISQALGAHPQIFNELYVEMVKAGEAAGTLDTILINLANTLERDYRLMLEIKNALRYPIIVVVAIVFAIIFITTFVVPRFAAVYSQFDVPLPLPTRVMIATSNFMLGYWWLLLILFFILITLFNLWKNSSQGKITWGKIKLKLPIFGPLFQKISILRFCFVFKTLNEVGLPIIKSLDIVKATLGNAFLAEKIARIREEVLEGKSLSALLLREKEFPLLLGNMLAVGEQSGAVDMVLDSLAEYYSLELTSIIDGLTVAIEPLLTALLAVCVLFLALAVFLPLWNITQLFKVGM